MIYKCSTCGTVLIRLEWRGDEVNTDFHCKKCLNEMEYTLTLAYEYQKTFLEHIDKKT